MRGRRQFTPHKEEPGSLEVEIHPIPSRKHAEHSDILRYLLTESHPQVLGFRGGIYLGLEPNE